MEDAEDRQPEALLFQGLAARSTRPFAPRGAAPAGVKPRPAAAAAAALSPALSLAAAHDVLRAAAALAAVLSLGAALTAAVTLPGIYFMVANSTAMAMLRIAPANDFIDSVPPPAGGPAMTTLPQRSKAAVSPRSFAGIYTPSYTPNALTV